MNDTMAQEEEIYSYARNLFKILDDMKDCMDILNLDLISAVAVIIINLIDLMHKDLTLRRASVRIPSLSRGTLYL